jgi:flagellin
MSIGKIGSNIAGQWAYQAFMDVSKKMEATQKRMSTGKKINGPEDDPAGYQLARQLERRNKGLNQALSNVTNAKAVLNIGEGAYKGIMDLLQVAKEKAIQASDAALNDSQRTAIHNQVSDMMKEVDELVKYTTFNGEKLIDGSFSKNFQVGEVAENKLSVSLANADSAALSLNSLSLSSAASAGAGISSLDVAIDKVGEFMQDLGTYKTRLNSKESTLETTIINTEAVRSNIEDADLIKEQMELTRLQIFQQAAGVAFSQANMAPQMVLNLFQ